MYMHKLHTTKTNKHTYAHTYMPTYLHTYIHTYMRTCIHTYIRIWRYLTMFPHIYTTSMICNTNMRTHTYREYIRICVHIYIYIYIYICRCNASRAPCNTWQESTARYCNSDIRPRNLQSHSPWRYAVKSTNNNGNNRIVAIINNKDEQVLVTSSNRHCPLKPGYWLNT